MCEWEIRVEFSEKNRIGEFIISMYPSLLEGATGKVCHWIVNSRNGKCC